MILWTAKVRVCLALVGRTLVCPRAAEQPLQAEGLLDKLMTEN
jgi:hypothetical protein